MTKVLSQPLRRRHPDVVAYLRRRCPRIFQTPTKGFPVCRFRFVNPRSRTLPYSLLRSSQSGANSCHVRFCDRATFTASFSMAAEYFWDASTSGTPKWPATPRWVGLWVLAEALPIIPCVAHGLIVEHRRHPLSTILDKVAVQMSGRCKIFTGAGAHPPDAMKGRGLRPS